MIVTKPVAAVMSYSNTSSDPRVLRQISWLSEAGFLVENHGLGELDLGTQVRHYKISDSKLRTRLLGYLEGNPEKRGAELTGRLADKKFLEKISSGTFNLIVLNDLDFLGDERLFLAAEKSSTPLILDLHEFFPDTGQAWAWRVLHGSFYKWLLGQVKRAKPFRVLTVSEEIAELYLEKLEIRALPIMNIPDSSFLPSKLNRKFDLESKIQLIHHGIWHPRRGILRVIRAMTKVEISAHLTLMLVAPNSVIRFLKAFIWSLGLTSKIDVIPPTSFDGIIPMLSNYDLEIIFYHPPHSKNHLYSLPNKFFEAIHAGLGLMVGQSLSMARIVRENGNGLVVDSWGHRALAKAINSLTTADISKFKENSLSALLKYNSESQKKEFQDICSAALRIRK
jgi:glycosyltransferase involved in cell wall biosynthesis